MATVLHLGLFPFCVAEKIPDYPASLLYLPLGTLKEAMDAIWRVKTWKFSVSGGSLSDYYTDFPESGTEKNLVCAAISHSANGIIGSGGVEKSWQIFAGASAPNNESIIKTNDQYYYYIGGAFGGGEYFGEFPPSTAQRTGYLEFTFTGISGDDNLTIVVTPDQWFPYDPDDGLGPIYDSSTGTQLRQFPSA